MSNFRRRLMMSFEKKYTPVKYLESTGAQWIDTEYKPNNHTKTILEGNYTTNAGKSMFGANPYFVITSSSLNDGILAFRYNNNIVRTQYSAYMKSKIEMSNKVYVNGALVTTYSETAFNSPYSALLFARHSSAGNVEEMSYSRIYNMKIYDNDILVRDYVPVLDATSRPCMFDKVEDKFYYNEGSGEFLYG